MADTLYEEAISFRRLDESDANGHVKRYISNHGPGSNHYSDDYQVAFGGAVIAFGISAAAQSVPSGFDIYSCLGNFLKASAPKDPILAEIRTLRQSRSFVTKHVTLLQVRRGKQVAVASMTVDFHGPEEAVLSFSASPTQQYASPDASWSWADMRIAAKNKGVPEEMLQMLDGTGSLSSRYFDRVCPPLGFNADTLSGIIPFLDESQAHLEAPEKVAAAYWRSRRPLPGVANAASVAFVMDAGMGIVAPGFAGLDLRDVLLTSSLDFALRFFTRDIKFDAWHLLESKALAAGAGRSFQASRIWDAHGNLVATMSQSCMLRGHPQEKL